MRAVIHGDDFTLLGDKENLMWFRSQVSKRFEAKFRGMIGPEKNDSKEITILNRTVRWTARGIEYEADKRHVEIALQQVGIESEGKAVSSPLAAKEELADEPLSQDMASRFRAIVARLNYLAQDRIDIQFAVKEMCRFMSAPKVEHWSQLKRLARYLKGCPRVKCLFGYQAMPKESVLWTDSNYAGCHVTRKSTSGGVLMFGTHCIKSWSVTQSVISLSSGEAEYYAMVKGASVALGFKSILKEVGVDVMIELKCDASAAVGIVMRKGLGRVRHIDVTQLWLQEKVAEKKIRITRVKSVENVSDGLTKGISGPEVMWMMGEVGQEITKDQREDK